MLTIQSLREYGANVEEGVQRCVNQEAFYLRLVSTVPGNKGFQALYDALEQKDLEAAFQAAHGLKGVAANLALTPLLKPVSEITELLRNKSFVDYNPLKEEIQKQQKALQVLCE